MEATCNLFQSGGLPPPGRKFLSMLGNVMHQNGNKGDLFVEYKENGNKRQNN